MTNFFEKIVTKFNLGNLTMEPQQITGGLTHKMFQIVTNKGKYIVKLLNPSIMKRPTAIKNFNQADQIEEILKKNHISAVYSLMFDHKKMHQLDEQYFYIYEWFDGKTLKDQDITQFHCEKMGEVLAKIHNIDFQYEKIERDEIHIDWNQYLELSKNQNPNIYYLLNDKIELLNNSMKKGNVAIKKLPSVKAICHNDMDSKNVMWLNDEFKLIDLECLGYNNPYLELFELALCWSGYETCNINFDLFCSFINSYLKNIIFEMNIDWEILFDSNYGRLEWLEFNIKRALMIECDTKEEQAIGIKEVRETLEHVVYYDKMKKDILDHIKRLTKCRP